MQRLVKILVGAAFALLATTAAHGQALAPGRALVWPTEFSNETFSCNQFAAARERYMRISRPRFNCTNGVDCPQDLQPSPMAVIPFSLHYDWINPSDPNLDITFSRGALDIVKATTAMIARSMDEVVRSKRRSIHVVGHTDTSATTAQNQKIAEALSICVKNMIEVSIHLNGYAGAYDFAMTMEARGDSDPARPTRSGQREPLNRRGEVLLRF